MARPYRSMLYIPAAKERALEKARTLPADAIIFDLEDAVLPEEKARAREILLAELKHADFGARARLVRINGLDTPWGRDDAAAFAQEPAVDGIVVPKVGRAADLDAVAALMPDVPLWAMMETARAMLNATEIAAHPRLAGLIVGTNDLGREIGSRFRPDRLPMMAGLGICVLAAKAEGRVVIDGVYNAFKDEAGLRAECEQGRDMGFDGKTVVHPDQLAVTNAVFAPSPDEISLALRQIEAFQDARARGQGVAVLDGRIVENMHVDTARGLLERAEAIAGGRE